MLQLNITGTMSPAQRFLSNDSTDDWGNIMSPLKGLNVNLHSAQNLAETLDQIKSMKSVKLANFAYIALDANKLLGQGSFSKVYKGKYKQQECAIKLIFTVDLTLDVIQRVAAESQILSHLRHPNVIGIYGVAVLPPSVCILLELCKYGSLSDIIRGGKHTGNSTKHRLAINMADLLYLVLGCARGLAAVHAIGTDVIHRDIKSYNFLVDSQLNAKVADLELGIIGTRSLNTNTPASREDSDDFLTKPGTNSTPKNLRPADEFVANWLPPELILDPLCTYQASDIYSFGMVLWECVTRGKIPFVGVRIWLFCCLLIYIYMYI